MIETLRPIAEAIRARGGRAIAVGGFVRDFLLGKPPKDLDVEVFDLAAAELEDVLRGFGEMHAFGRSFPVMRVAGREIDFSLARGSDFAEAARRRDLTIHAIGLDPLSGELLDPLGGRADLAARVLRAADPRTFGSDPLRGLRVMQVAARFAMEPDAELLALCRALDLADLPGERLLRRVRQAAAARGPAEPRPRRAARDRARALLPGPGPLAPDGARSRCRGSAARSAPPRIGADVRGLVPRARRRFRAPLPRAAARAARADRAGGSAPPSLARPRSSSRATRADRRRTGASRASSKRPA